MINGIINVLGPPLIIASLAVVAGILFAKDRPRWFMRAGGALLAAGVVGPLLLGMLLAHPGDQSDIGMKGTIIMLVFFPSGLLMLALGLAMSLWTRRRTPPQP